MKSKLPIYKLPPDSDLSEFVKSKRDKQKGIDSQPYIAYQVKQGQIEERKGIDFMAEVRSEKNLKKEDKWNVFDEVDWDDLEERNFEKVKVIGEGGFGKVCLVR